MIDIFYATISGEEHERLDKLDAERRAHTERLTVKIAHDLGASRETPRPWRPEQHAADTVLGHFDTSGKAVTHD